MEVIVVHVVHHSLLLGRVDIDALVFLVDRISQLLLHLGDGEPLFVKAFLLFSDFVHI